MGTTKLSNEYMFSAGYKYTLACTISNKHSKPVFSYVPWFYTVAPTHNPVIADRVISIDMTMVRILFMCSVEWQEYLYKRVKPANVGLVCR